MYSIHSKLLSQNFLHNRALVSKLIGRTCIGKNDLVLEIGPGKGMITRELLLRAGHVIAVELDRKLYQELQSTFRFSNNLTLHHRDFLLHTLPSVPYVVFANIPFSLEGKIIRKLLDSTNPPQDCYLVVRRSFAKRLSQDGKNMFMAMYSPWFTFTIVHHFRPNDFSPATHVGAVLFRCARRKQPFLPWGSRSQYNRFIQQAYGNGRAVYQNLQSYFPREELTHLFEELSLSKKGKPNDLSVHAWVKLFQRVQECY